MQKQIEIIRQQNPLGQRGVTHAASGKFLTDAEFSAALDGHVDLVERRVVSGGCRGASFGASELAKDGTSRCIPTSTDRLMPPYTLTADDIRAAL